MREADEERAGSSISIDPYTVNLLRAHRAASEGQCKALGVELAHSAFVFSLEPQATAHNKYIVPTPSRSPTGLRRPACPSLRTCRTDHATLQATRMCGLARGTGGGMQTFLPWAGFAETAEVLDPRRLGKQRVEALQILRGLTVPGYGWRHHPAVKMWAGYEEALVRYGLEICAAWTASGRADTCELILPKDLADGCDIHRIRTQEELARAGDLPPWLGDEALHRSHRSALLRKDPEHYGKYFDEPPDLPYVWPASDRTPCRR